MEKKYFIKELEKIPGNPDIGINVLTDVGSEFWSLSKRAMSLHDKGTNLSLFQVRQRKAFNATQTLSVKAPPVDSIDTTLETVLSDFCDKFEILGDNASIFNEDDFTVKEFILNVLRQEISELVKMNEDFLRVFGEPKLLQKYQVLTRSE